MENATDTAWKIPIVKTRRNHKTMEDSTSLDSLLMPQGPQSNPPIIPMPSVPTPGHSAMAPTFKPSLPAVRFMFANTTLYLAIFLAGAIVSLSFARNLLLQYIPSAYTSGGVVSWTGAAILGGATVVLTNLLNTFLQGFMG